MIPQEGVRSSGKCDPIEIRDRRFSRATRSYKKLKTNDHAITSFRFTTLFLYFLRFPLIVNFESEEDLYVKKTEPGIAEDMPHYHFSSSLCVFFFLKR